MINPYSVIRAAERVSSRPAKVITGQSRKSCVVTVRDACIYLIHEMTGMSSREISVIFNREHSSIRYAILRSEDRLTLCPKFRAAYEAIKRAI